MSDDLNDEQIVLASAYLDGEVTSAERAQVEADPQLLAEVGRLRSVSTSLGEATDVPISTRERHLAAALGAWDRLSDAERSGDNSGGIPAVAADPAAAAGAATVTAPTPLADRRNKKSGQKSGQKSGWMLTAAAVLLVVAGGGLIARGIIESGSDDSSIASESVELPAQRDDLSDAAADEILAADEPAAEAVPIDVTPELAAEAESAIGSTIGSSDEVEVIDSAERLAEFAEQELAVETSRQGEDLDSASDAPVEAAAEEAPAAEEPAAEPVADVPTAESADSAATSVTILTEDDLRCGLVDRIIGEAEYGDGLFPKPVAIGVNADETEVVAYRVDTCEVVARAPLGG